MIGRADHPLRRTGAARAAPEGRARPHDPPHIRDEHPVVAPGRALLVRPTGRPMISPDIRSQGASLNTSRSGTPKTAQQEHLVSTRPSRSGFRYDPEQRDAIDQACVSLAVEVIEVKPAMVRP